MTEYERGRKDLADEIIEKLDEDIEIYNIDCLYGDEMQKAVEAEFIKQYIQELIGKE